MAGTTSIIHVADAFIAMTLDRPYRAAMSRDAAIVELIRLRGRQFDPDVVDALVELSYVEDRAAA